MLIRMKILFLILLWNSLECNNYKTFNPTFDSYSDVLVRGAKNPGFWGAVPPNNANVFDHKWNSDGYQQIYNLNSQSPFAGMRSTGFDTTTTKFNQYGPTSFEVIPVNSNFMPQSRINAYSYDLNEPRMQAIYKNYMRMMNKNLDRLSNVLKGNTEFTDLNNNELRKLKNPASFDYKTQYFDGLSESKTAPSYYHQRVSFVPSTQKDTTEERRLNLSSENHKQGKIQKIKQNLHKIEQKIKFLEQLNKEDKIYRKKALKV